MMKKVDVNMKYNELVEIAKKFGIKWVGIKKEAIVENINKKIEEYNKQLNKKEKGMVKMKKEKWYHQPGALPFKGGEVVVINENYPTLTGRKAIITIPSKKEKTMKAHLINEKLNRLQRTQIELRFDQFEVIEEFSTTVPVAIPLEKRKSPTKKQQKELVLV